MLVSHHILGRGEKMSKREKCLASYFLPVLIFGRDKKDDMSGESEYGDRKDVLCHMSAVIDYRVRV